LASSEQEWIEKLSILIDDPKLRIQMGEKARLSMAEKYSGRVWAHSIARMLRDTAITRT
jgi:hypothetical protein